MSDMTPVERRIRDDEARGFNLVRCTACGQKVHLRRARLGLCVPVTTSGTTRNSCQTAGMR